MGNQKPMSFNNIKNDCVKDNVENIKNDSAVRKDAKNPTSSQRELRVVLEDVCKENRGLLYFCFCFFI